MSTNYTHLGDFSFSKLAWGAENAEVVVINSAGTLVCPINTSGNVTIGDAATDTLLVKAAATFSSTLTVGGVATLKSNATVSGTFAVLGVTTLKSNLGVSGTLTVRGNSTLKSTVTLGSAASTVTHACNGGLTATAVIQGTGCYATSSGVGPIAGAVFTGGVSGRFSSVPTTNVAAGSIEAVCNISTNTVIAAAAASAVPIGGIYSRFVRTVTDDVTDTTTNGFSAFASEMRWSVSSGKTYTFTDANGYANFSAPAVTVSGGGTCAVSHYAKFRVENDAVNTGTTKYGLYIGNLSGATNNWSLYTGSAPSFMWGMLQIGNQADPGAVTDSIALGSQDVSSGNATLSLRTETAVASETITPDRTITIFINGSKYKIPLLAL